MKKALSWFVASVGKISINPNQGKGNWLGGEEISGWKEPRNNRIESGLSHTGFCDKTDVPVTMRLTKSFRPMLAAGGCILTVVGTCVAETALSPELAALKPHVVLAASFDGKLAADHAAGDAALYTAPTAARLDKIPGLPAAGTVRHAKGEGRVGDALFFTKKMKPVVFFEGGVNLGYSATRWNGTCSFWLRLDPDKDLEPGYCDPLQLVGPVWDAGHMFAEFSKDHTPRRFRFAIRPVKKLWNPDNVKWEDSPEKPNLMAESVTPPFRNDQWTHVAMTFEGVNVQGEKALGVLYLNGNEVGRFQREQLFDWDPAKSALTLGLSYVGGLDELLFLNRALTSEEVRALFESKMSVSEFARRG